jgi:hypothetical protein
VRDLHRLFALGAADLFARVLRGKAYFLAAARAAELNDIGLLRLCGRWDLNGRAAVWTPDALSGVLFGGIDLATAICACNVHHLRLLSTTFFPAAPLIAVKMLRHALFAMKLRYTGHGLSKLFVPFAARKRQYTILSKDRSSCISAKLLNCDDGLLGSSCVHFVLQSLLL